MDEVLHNAWWVVPVVAATAAIVLWRWLRKTRRGVKFVDRRPRPPEPLLDRRGADTTTDPLSPADLSAANYLLEDKRDVWPIYQIAFLWHGYDPPSIYNHRALMTLAVADTKQSLRDAAREQRLVAEKRQVGNSHILYVRRDDLLDYCEATGDRPAFLFPEQRRRDAG